MAKEVLKEGKAIRRRDFVRGVAIAGVVGATAAMGASAISLIPPPSEESFVQGDFGFTYTAGPQQANAWFKGLVGKPVRASDFPLGQGALAFWEGVPVLKPCWVLYLDPNVEHVTPTGKVSGWVDTTGEASVIEYNKGVFVAFYGGCVHACCIPGWHEAYPDLDVFHCTCHNSRYDPWELVHDKEPATGATYIGARRIQLPAQRAQPYIPIKLVSDRIMGTVDAENVEWYRNCGVKKKSA